MAKSSWTLDDRVLTRRLRAYVKASGKSIPEALNRAGRNTAFKAIRLTKKTKLAQITADVGTVANPTSGAYAAYLHGHPGAGKLPKGSLLAKIQAMIKSKRSSIGYIAAGFLMAARAFGQTLRSLNPRSLAARGYGKKATVHHYVSELMNTAPGADTVALRPLEEAAHAGLDDMMAYLGRTNRIAASAFNR